MFGNNCRSRQIHSLSMSAITSMEHNELKHLAPFTAWAASQDKSGRPHKTIIKPHKNKPIAHCSHFFPASLESVWWCNAMCLWCNHQQSQAATWTCHGILQHMAVGTTHCLPPPPIPEELLQSTSHFPCALRPVMHLLANKQLYGLPTGLVGGSAVLSASPAFLMLIQMCKRAPDWWYVPSYLLATYYTGGFVCFQTQPGHWPSLLSLKAQAAVRCKCCVEVLWNFCCSTGCLNEKKYILRCIYGSTWSPFEVLYYGQIKKKANRTCSSGW